MHSPSPPLSDNKTAAATATNGLVSVTPPAALRHLASSSVNTSSFYTTSNIPVWFTTCHKPVHLHWWQQDSAHSLFTLHVSCQRTSVYGTSHLPVYPCHEMQLQPTCQGTQCIYCILQALHMSNQVIYCTQILHFMLQTIYNNTLVIYCASKAICQGTQVIYSIQV